MTATRRLLRNQLRLRQLESNRKLPKMPPETKVWNDVMTLSMDVLASGIMGNVLDGDANRNYESSRPAGRAVKEEAREGADRNKTGTMGDVMGG